MAATRFGRYSNLSRMGNEKAAVLPEPAKQVSPNEQNLNTYTLATATLPKTAVLLEVVREHAQQALDSEQHKLDPSLPDLVEYTRSCFVRSC